MEESIECNRDGCISFRGQKKEKENTKEEEEDKEKDKERKRERERERESVRLSRSVWQVGHHEAGQEEDAVFRRTSCSPGHSSVWIR